MMRAKTVIVAGAALGVAGALAWQGGAAAAGWAESDMPRVAKAFLVDTTPPQLPGVYLLKEAVRKQLKAMDGAQRAKVVEELARWARSYASRPEVAKLYDGWIKSRYDAVNHGIKADQASEQAAFDNPAAMNNMLAQAAAGAAMSIYSVPIASLKMAFPQDLKSWGRRSDAKSKRLAAKANEIAPLADSNPEEFKKQYAILKSIEMGGPDTWAGIQAAAAGGQQAEADSKKRQQQRAYDEHTLKAELKKRLQTFVTLARSVDFAAQTRETGNRRLFVNLAYESKPDAWKMLYRLGKEPTMAAVAAAEAWLKEL